MSQIYVILIKLSINIESLNVNACESNGNEKAPLLGGAFWLRKYGQNVKLCLFNVYRVKTFSSFL